MTGERASLQTHGIFPYCVLMQVAAEDTEAEYVLCRGFDVRINKFIDYEEGNDDKPGIPVAKPYGFRSAGVYELAQVCAAALPVQCSAPSPTTAPMRLGQNPGKAADSVDQPADLDEELEELYTTDGKAVNWMFIGSSGGAVVPCRITEALVSGGSAAAVLLTGATRSTDGAVITVKDIPTMITSGYQIPDETICRVVYDGVVGSHVLAVPAVCEEEQPE